MVGMLNFMLLTAADGVKVGPDPCLRCKPLPWKSNSCEYFQTAGPRDCSWLCNRKNRGFKKDATTGRAVRHTECHGLAKLVCFILCHLGEQGFYFIFYPTVDLEQHLICLSFLSLAGKCDCICNFPWPQLPEITKKRCSHSDTQTTLTSPLFLSYYQALWLMNRLSWTVSHSVFLLMMSCKIFIMLFCPFSSLWKEMTAYVSLDGPGGCLKIGCRFLWKRFCF